MPGVAVGQLLFVFEPAPSTQASGMALAQIDLLFAVALATAPTYRRSTALLMTAPAGTDRTSKLIGIRFSRVGVK